MEDLLTEQQREENKIDCTVPAHETGTKFLPPPLLARIFLWRYLCLVSLEIAYFTICATLIGKKSGYCI